MTFSILVLSWMQERPIQPLVFSRVLFEIRLSTRMLVRVTRILDQCFPGS